MRVIRIIVWAAAAVPLFIFASRTGFYFKFQPNFRLTAIVFHSLFKIFVWAHSLKCNRYVRRLMRHVSYRSPPGLLLSPHPVLRTYRLND